VERLKDEDISPLALTYSNLLMQTRLIATSSLCKQQQTFFSNNSSSGSSGSKKAGIENQRSRPAVAL